MTDQEHTAKRELWNLGSEDSERLEDFVTEMVSDHIDFAIKQLIGEINAYFGVQDGEPGILLGWDDDEIPDVFIPLHKVMWDPSGSMDIERAVKKSVLEYLQR